MATAANAVRTAAVGVVAIVAVAPELMVLVAAPTIVVGVMAVKGAKETRLALMVARDAGRKTSANETGEVVAGAPEDVGTAPGAATTEASHRPPPFRLRAPAQTTVVSQ